MVVSLDLLRNLHEKSSLGVVAQIKLLAELFDDLVRLVTLVDADLFDMFAIQFNLEHANRLFKLGHMFWRCTVEVLTHLRLVVGRHLWARMRILARSLLRLELPRALVHRSRSVLLRACLQERLLLLVPRIALSLLRCTRNGLHLRLRCALRLLDGRGIVLPVVGWVGEQMLLARAGRVIPQLVNARGVSTSLRRARSRAGPWSLALLLRHRCANGLILLHMSRLSLRLLIQYLWSAGRLRFVLVALLIEALLSTLSHLCVLGLLNLHLGLLGHLSLLLESLLFLMRMSHRVHVLELLVDVLDLLVIQAERLPIDEAANSMELVH